MRVDRSDGIERVTLDRPAVRNALTPELVVELATTVEAAAPAELDAIVLTGEGETFCSGGNLHEMADRDWPAEERPRIVAETFGRLTEAMLEADVPIVARINGDAVGAGLSLVLLADFAFAVERATFSAGFARVGLIPDTGGTFLLPAIVGLRAAKELALTAEFVDARRAAELDLITEAVADDVLDDRVEDCLERLRVMPTATLGRVRRAMHDNLGRPYPDALDREAYRQATAYGSEDHREGVAAFLEERTPDYPT